MLRLFIALLPPAVLSPDVLWYAAGRRGGASPAGRRDSGQSRDVRPGIRATRSRSSFEAAVEGAPPPYSFKKVKNERIERREEMCENKGAEFLCFSIILV
jgi:hypothetical protein